MRSWPPQRDTQGGAMDTEMRSGMRFRDRVEAGQVLAEDLARYADRDDVVVLALPRGGVPVGYQVARALHDPLELSLVRKRGVPVYEELAMVALASGGVVVLNQAVIRAMEIDRATVDEVSAREQAELARREQAYRGGRPLVEVAGKTVILVDGGL